MPHRYGNSHAGTRFSDPGGMQSRVDLGTAVEVHSPCPRLYVAVAVVINTTALSGIRTWVSHTAVGRANSQGYCNLQYSGKITFGKETCVS